MAAAGGGGRAIDDDELTLMVIGVLAWPVLAGAAVWAWSQGGSWLVKYQVLVAAKAGPLLTVPGMNGAGLDTARLMILTGVLLSLAACTVFGIGRAVAARRAAAVQ